MATSGVRFQSGTEVRGRVEIAARLPHALALEEIHTDGHVIIEFADIAVATRD